MKPIRQRARLRTFSGQLWRRVIGRRACIEGLVRPRTPLVFARRAPAEIVHRSAGPIVTNEFRLALSLDFSWPTWVVDARSWPSVRPVVAAIPLRTRMAGSPALVARRAESGQLLSPAFPRRVETAGASRQLSPHMVGAAHPASLRRDHHTSIEITHRHLFPRLVPPPAASGIVPRSPLAARAAGIAALRAPAAAAPMSIEPVAAVRRARGVSSPESTSAVPPMAMVTGRTITRIERATEVVHHRTSFEQPVSRVLRQDANAPAASAASPVTERATPAPPFRPVAPAPVIDVERLSDEVYRHIQRRVRIERERRGA